MEKYKIGEIIECHVSGIESYGIFVKVDSQFNGLIHISEITYNYVRNINDYVQVGDIIYAKIIKVDEKKYKINLSIKDVNFKKNLHEKKIVESERGFNPLKEMLPWWTNEKLKEMKKIG